MSGIPGISPAGRVGEAAASGRHWKVMAGLAAVGAHTSSAEGEDIPARNALLKADFTFSSLLLVILHAPVFILPECLEVRDPGSAQSNFNFCTGVEQRCISAS